MNLTSLNHDDAELIRRAIDALELAAQALHDADPTESLSISWLVQDLRDFLHRAAS